MLFIYFLIFEHSQGSKIAEYLPSYNYGQVFHDFSENALPSVNGISSLDVVNDILYTDRGSFFNGNSDQMLLPPNNNASLNFVIPPTFSVILWLMSFPSDGLIFQRYGSSSNYFYFNRKQSAKSLQVCVKTSTINTGVLSTASNTLPKGIF